MFAPIKAAVKGVLPDNLLVHLQSWDHYYFGENEIRLLSKFCARDRIALDIGANIGTYTYFLRKLAKHVYAYEPNPELAAALTKRFPDVTVRQAAVSDRRCELTLRIPVEGTRAQHELASVAQSFKGASSVIEYPVECISVDDEELDDVGFIKVDVEQHELPVLHGAINTIRRYRPLIMTEISPLLYPVDLKDAFAFILAERYEGWFRWDMQYHRLSTYAQEKHADESHWGTQKFIGNNLILAPRELELVLH